MIIRNLASIIKAIWQNRFYCRRALADGLKKSLKKKALRINYWRRKHLMTAQLLLELIINGTKVPPGVAHF